MMQHEEQRSAVDAAGEQHAERFVRVDAIQPFVALGSQRADVRRADLVEVGRESIPLRGKEPSQRRTRIRAAEQRDLGQMVSRDHAGVRRVKLIAVAFRSQPGGDFVDSFGNDQARPLGPLGQEVPHRPADGSRHADEVAALRPQRELPIDFADASRISGLDPFGRVGDRHVQQHITCRGQQIDNSFDVSLVHGDLGVMTKSGGILLVYFADYNTSNVACAARVQTDSYEPRASQEDWSDG